jgi:hypothetical protein
MLLCLKYKMLCVKKMVGDAQNRRFYLSTFDFIKKGHWLSDNFLMAHVHENIVYARRVGLKTATIRFASEKDLTYVQDDLCKDGFTVVSYIQKKKLIVSGWETSPRFPSDNFRSWNVESTTPTIIT